MKKFSYGQWKQCLLKREYCYKLPNFTFLQLLLIKKKLLFVYILIHLLFHVFYVASLYLNFIYILMYILIIHSLSKKICFKNFMFWCQHSNLSDWENRATMLFKPKIGYFFTSEFFFLALEGEKIYGINLESGSKIKRTDFDF